MSYSRAFEKRQIVPRWHTYGVAQWLGVTMPARSDLLYPESGTSFRDKIDSWENSKSLVRAADLVGNALSLGLVNDDAALEASDYILSKKNIATAPVLELSRSYKILSKNEAFPIPEIDISLDEKDYHKIIRCRKHMCREYPRNPIHWMDLAFYYCAIGQSESANKCVQIALSLNQRNRYILRSASRFYLHSGQADRALHILRRSLDIQDDPWLAAAELAISDSVGQSSKKTRVAQKLLTDQKISPFHRSELAGTFGTLEFENGADKKGKKLFRLALMEPTENTLAQAVFLQDRLGQEIASGTVNKLAQSFEASCKLSMGQGCYGAAVEAAKRWLAYQPFSSRPAIQGSYASAVCLGDHDQAIRFTKMGLLSSPNNFLLNNNLAFSLASTGKVSEALRIAESLKKKNLSGADSSILSATLGLIEFRKGDLQTGRELYSHAIDYFKKNGESRSLALATSFLAYGDAHK